MSFFAVVNGLIELISMREVTGRVVDVALYLEVLVKVLEIAIPLNAFVFPLIISD